MNEAFHVAARAMRTQMLLTDPAQVAPKGPKLAAPQNGYRQARAAMERNGTSAEGRALPAAIDAAAWA